MIYDRNKLYLAAYTIKIDTYPHLMFYRLRTASKRHQWIRPQPVHFTEERRGYVKYDR